MHYNYKLGKQAITDIIKRHIKPIERQKQIKLIIYNIKIIVKITPTLLKYSKTKPI